MSKKPRKLKKNKLRKEDLPEVEAVSLENGNLVVEGLEESSALAKEHNLRPGAVPIFIGDECFDSRDLADELLRRSKL